MHKPVLALDVEQLLTRNRRKFGATRMTMPPAPPVPSNQPPAPAPGDPGNPPPTPPVRTFTQEEVTRMMAAEKDQGRRAGAAEALQQLGVTDAAEAQRILTAHQEAERNKLTEAERAAADAARAKAEAEADRQAAAMERHQAKLERALARAGVTAADRAARMLYDVPVDADEAAVTAAVEQLKTDMPALFVAADPVDPAATPPGQQPPAPGSDPGTPPPPAAGTRTPDGGFGASGRAEAARRFPPQSA